MKKSVIRSNSHEDWTQVLGLLGEGFRALRVLPILAVILALLAWLVTHHPRQAPSSQATASCVTCLDR